MGNESRTLVRVTSTQKAELELYAKKAERAKRRRIAWSSVGLLTALGGIAAGHNYANASQPLASEAHKSLDSITLKIDNEIPPAMEWAAFITATNNITNAQKSLRATCEGFEAGPVTLPPKWTDPNGDAAKASLKETLNNLQFAKTTNATNPRKRPFVNSDYAIEVKKIEASVPNGKSIESQGNECVFSTSGQWGTKFQPFDSQMKQIDTVKGGFDKRINELSPDVSPEIMEKRARGDISVDIKAIDEIKAGWVAQKNTLLPAASDADVAVLKGRGAEVLLIGLVGGIVLYKGGGAALTKAYKSYRKKSDTQPTYR